MKKNRNRYLFIFFILFFTVKSFGFIIFDKPYYFRSDIIKLFVDSDADYIKVYHDGKPFLPFSDMEKISLKRYSEKLRIAYLPLGFEPSLGIYDVISYKNGKEIERASFKLFARKVKKVSDSFHIWTVEYGGNYDRIKVDYLTDRKTSKNNIDRWMKFLNIDNLFIMVGQTNAKLPVVNKDMPWIPYNLKSWKDFVNEHRNFSMGGYIGSFLAFGPARRKMTQYTFSYDYELSKKRLYKSNFISITDKNRVGDIIKLAKEIDRDPNIKFVGLDYIRAGFGDFENYKRFCNIFNIKIKGKDEMEKIKNLAYLVKTDDIYSKKWKYYLAIEAADVIKKVAENINKPLWCFTLGWDQGHEHGQDPVIFSDAGADLIMVMMYESSQKMHKRMMPDWAEYLSKVKGLQIVVGETLDLPLNDANEVEKSGPEEMLRRFVSDYNSFNKNGNLKGFFIHDLTRAFYGRILPYYSNEWLLAAKSAFTYYDTHGNRNPISIDAALKKGEIVFSVKNNSKKDFSIKKLYFYPFFWKKFNKKSVILRPNETITLKLPYYEYKRKYRRGFVAIILETEKRNYVKSFYYPFLKRNEVLADGKR